MRLTKSMKDLFVIIGLGAAGYLAYTFIKKKASKTSTTVKEWKPIPPPSGYTEQQAMAEATEYGNQFVKPYGQGR